MEGLAAAHGGRKLKRGLLAFGALLWTVPVLAQPGDPLAPLPEQSPPSPAITQSQASTPLAPPPAAKPLLIQPVPTRPAPTPGPSVAVPRDWRGVFDAIDSGSWASAQAGIATLPRSILTPVAKAELYTAKGSPVVDLNQLQALIAEAPELPQAEQLAAMA